MTFEEFGDIMTFMQDSLGKEIKKKETAKIYFDMLKDFTKEECMNGVKKLIAENVYPNIPTIGSIRQAVIRLRELNLLTPIEGLRLVNLAIQKFGHDQPKEARQFMGINLWMMVEAMGGWYHICMDSTPGVWHSYFLKNYESLMKRGHEVAMLPTELREKLTNLAQGMTLSCEKKGELTDGH